jgi:DNA-directed RNA polymerase specialized sigma24 family protein
MRTSPFTLHPSDAQHISKLSKQHAAVLALFRENPNYETMAAAMGCKLGTIKSSLFRARAAIVKMRAEAAQSVEAA